MLPFNRHIKSKISIWYFSTTSQPCYFGFPTVITNLFPSKQNHKRVKRQVNKKQIFFKQKWSWRTNLIINYESKEKLTSANLFSILSTNERLLRNQFLKITLIGTDIKKCLHSKKNNKSFSITYDGNAVFWKIASLPHKLKSFSTCCAGKCFLDILSCGCFVFEMASRGGKLDYYVIRGIFSSKFNTLLCRRSLVLNIFSTVLSYTPSR